jgi:GDP-L-fucose synthase
MYHKILVTGGTGLLGSAIQAVSGKYPGGEFLFVGSRDCDLTRLDDTVGLVDRFRPDAIIHTAALAGGIQYSQKHPATLLRDNVLMNLNVLEAARLHCVAKCILTLSTGMYPVDAPNPIREEYIHDGPPHESNYSYSFAKRLIEPSIRAYRTEYGMNVIGLVSNGIFGERANFRPEESVMVAALIRRFCESRQSNEPIVIWGDGSPVREYTYAKDMARAYLWCLDHYDDPQILHVGSVEEHSVKETAWMIAEILCISPDRIVFDSSKPGGIQKKSTDNSRFIERSRFRYTPFRIGLESTIRWFCDNYGKKGNIRL